jgi:hypothetical protein
VRESYLQAIYSEKKFCISGEDCVGGRNLLDGIMRLIFSTISWNLGSRRKITYNSNLESFPKAGTAKRAVLLLDYRILLAPPFKISDLGDTKCTLLFTKRYKTNAFFGIASHIVLYF